HKLCGGLLRYFLLSAGTELYSVLDYRVGVVRSQNSYSIVSCKISIRDILSSQKAIAILC
ncbi:MAG: hypothetical protein AAF208_14800, partial [Cyanobacteria bacterium P01_A01_bin.45]